VKEQSGVVEIIAAGARTVVGTKSLQSACLVGFANMANVNTQSSTTQQQKQERISELNGLTSNNEIRVSLVISRYGVTMEDFSNMILGLELPHSSYGAKIPHIPYDVFFLNPKWHATGVLCRFYSLFLHKGVLQECPFWHVATSTNEDSPLRRQVV
jgi:hypothetical protein